MSIPAQPRPGKAQLTQVDRVTFPGLIPEEIIVFKAWLALHAAEYTSYAYNVRVGRGFDPGPAFDDNARRNAIANSQRRIDALLYRGAQPYIIEVKRRANIQVMGQLIAYVDLWHRDNTLQPQPVPILVCSTIDNDLAYVMQKRGLAFNVVAADFSTI